jgi:hypothetical protein
MFDQKWSSIRVLEKPLSILFLYKSGNFIKSAKIDELFESETKWKNPECVQGASQQPDSPEPFLFVPGSPEPFLTREETVAARRLLCEMGILLG